MEQNSLFPQKAKEIIPDNFTEPETTPAQKKIAQSSTITAENALTGLRPMEFDAGEIFSGKKSNNPVWGFAQPSYYTPERDPNYIFHNTCQDICLWHMAEPEPLYVYGAAGAGKTSLIKQVASILNYPVFEITGHARLEFADLVGQPTVKNGGMEFQYGPLSLAMKYGGICLLNEIDITDPATLCGLNSILDGSPLCIPENQGELIKPHRMFHFVATANSNGRTDDAGLYQGVLAQNLAFMDRFWVVKVEYPSKQAEETLLAKVVPELSPVLTRSMIELATEVRESFMNEDANGMEVTFSTRTLIRWAKLTLMYAPLAKHGIKPVGHALDRALGFKAQPSTREALPEMVQRIIPSSLQRSFNDEGDESESESDEEDSAQELPATAAIPLNNQAKTWFDFREELMRIHSAGNRTIRAYFATKTPVVVLLQQTNSGGKFWKCEATLNEVTTTWGRIGTNGQSKTYSAAECKYKNPFLDMIHRVDAKIRSGYTLDSSATIV